MKTNRLFLAIAALALVALLSSGASAATTDIWFTGGTINGGNNVITGTIIKPNYNINTITVELFDNMDATAYCAIWNVTTSINAAVQIANVSVTSAGTNRSCVFSAGLQLNRGEYYFVGNGKNQVSGNQQQDSVAPVVTGGTNVNFSNASSYYLNGASVAVYSSTQHWNIRGITSSTVSGGPGPSVTLVSPANATEAFYKNTVQISTTANNFGGAVNQSQYLYNSSGGLVRQLNATNATSFLGNFTGSFVPGIYFFNATATNNTHANYTETRQINITAYNGILNLTLKNATNGAIIGTASINATDLNTSRVQWLNTTTGSFLIPIDRNDTLNLSINAAGFALATQSHTTNNSATQYLNISLYGSNSVTVYIYDEETSNPITENITIAITATGYSLTTSSSAGTFYIEDLEAKAYTFQFSSANYTVKSYIVTVTNKSTQTLNAYLSRSVQNTIFTITDYNTGLTIEGASLVVERLFNGTYTVVDNKLSDITGRVQIIYLPNTLYRFTASKTNYSSKVFTLNPVLFSTYTVSLQKSQSSTNNQDYADVGVTYYPRTFFNNQNNTFTFTITSPLGKLEADTLNLSWPGGFNHSSSVNAYGVSRTVNVNISGASFGSHVNLSFSYQAGGILRNFSFPLEIIGYTGANQTIVSIKGHDYGLGKFEKVLLTMFAVVIMAGFAYLAIGIQGALFIGLLVEGVSVYLGFLDLWAFLISALVGLVLIFRLGGDNV